jgi:drug/metabolite transporter (DMT)-like permease
VPALSEGALGATCALASALTWTLSGLLVRRLHDRFSSLSLSALRSILGGGLLLVGLIVTAGPAALGAVSRGALGLLIGSIVLAVIIGDTVFFESTRSLGLARAMTISMSYPVASALLAAAVLDEPITPAIAAGSLLTLGGLALIVLSRDGADPRPQRFWPGVGAASLASLAWAVSVIMLRAPLREMDPLAAQAIRLPMAGLLLCAMPPVWGAAGTLRRAPRRVVTTVLVLGVLSAVSSVLFVAGVKHAGVAVATVLSAASPMFALPLGVLFLGERPGPVAVLGTAVTVVGVVVLQL